MPYQITLPDGSIGLIADSVPKDRAMEAAEAAYPDAFPGIGEQLLGAPGELAKGFARGFVDPVSGLLSTGYTGLRAAGMELDPFAETAVGKGLAGVQEYLAPDYGTVSQFAGALGGLGSFLVPGAALAKGLGRTATLGGMATGLGAEEARSRVEEARAEGIEVTPSQEFGVQLGGGVIGISELAPIERLTGPLQAVLRGVKKSDADMIAPGLFNSAKRMVETGGIEGLQEGMANIAQDLLAKGVYNPNLDVGESALGDAAMGASVGAFAQGAIELVTKGRRRQLYDTLKAEEDAKARIAEAEKSRLAEEADRKKTLANFGVEGQPLLLAAPQGQITPSRQEKSSIDQYGVEDRDLFEPFGTFTRDELDKDVVKELDKRRKEAGRPKTETFTLQDIADTGVYRGELNRLIAQRSGYTGDLKFKPSEVVGLAEQKNIDTSTQGFSDFVGRVTGKKPLPNLTGINSLRGLNDVELFAVREAINKLPTYEQKKILPTGKAAKIFDDKQSTKTLTSIKKTLGEDLGAEGLGETSILQEIGDYSGLEDVNDQKSLLEKYITDGELERVSTPAVAVLDANGNQVSVIKGSTQAERLQAQKKAQEIGGTIKDTSINQIRTPDPVNRLIGGLDIRQGTFEDTVAEGYDITTETGEVIGKAKTLTQAEAQANRATQLREQRQVQLLDAKQKIQENIAKGEQAMADLESLGRKDSEDFKKIQNSMAAQERNLAKVEQNLVEFGKGVSVKPRHKQQKRTGFTLFEGNKPVGTYNSRQEALEASVVAQPTDRLEAMLEAFPALSASPGMDRADIKKLQQVAANELASRKGEIPSGVAVTVEGDITAAEERLALQGIFSPRIKERVNELDKKLRAALDKLGLKDVRLNIVGAIKGDLGVADGAYAARLIKIALDAENPMRVLRHEGIHALKELGAFTPDQWRVLENKAKSEWMAKYNIAERYRGLDPASMLEEAISDAFSDFSQTKPPAGLIGNVFSRIKSFFTALDNGFKGLGFQTADDVFGRVERGELLPGMGERAAEVEGLQAQRVVAETPERYALKTVQDVIDDGIDRLVKSALKTPSGFQDMFNDRYMRGFGRIDYNLQKIEEGIFQRLHDLGVSKERDSMGRREDQKIVNDILYRANQKFKEIRSGGQPTEQYSLRRVPPSKVVSSVIEDLGLSDAEVAATSLGLQTGKGGTDAFKQQNVGGIRDIVDFLENRYRNSGLPNLDLTQEADRDLLSKLLSAEVLSAIRSGGANIQWYDKVIDQMLGMASLKYPELRTDPNAQAAFRIAISVSSQGQNVEDNLKFGERVYEQFSQNAERGKPRFPEIGTGESMKAMQNNFRIANRMIDKMGMDNFRKFLETPFTVQELNSVGMKITGELADEQVLGSSVFGPKIGFGFYSNLSGNFEPVTMDMWFMRTIGRLIGKLKEFDPAKYANQVQRFRGSFGLSGDNGIYSNEFSQEEINQAIVDEQAMIDLARKVKSLHERDFKKNRDLFDSGQREKTDFVKAAENIIKSLDSPKDAPSTGAERRLLRDVVRRMRQRIADVTGQDIPPASLQAIAWYPEQELYKALGAKLRVTSQNYANSMRKLLEGEGFDGDRISESAKLGSRRTRRADAGEVAAGTRPTGRRPSRTLSPEEREAFLEEGREEVFFEREREEPKAKTVVFEVAPNPDDVELTNRWNQLTPDQKLQISQEVVNKILPDAMKAVGVQGYLANQIGSYENETNPSFGLFVRKGTGEQIQELAKMLGYALRQKSMVVASPKEAKGLYKNGAVRIEVGDISIEEADRIYQSLRDIRVNGEQILDGQTTVHGNMVVLNFSNLKIDKFAKTIHDHLKGDYNITVDDIYSNLIEEKDYDYGDPKSDPGGNRGVLRERSRTLWAEATKLLETRLKQAVPKTKDKYSLRGTNTPEFREWFGRSEIVDDQGRPRVMYHGTARDITEFKAKQAGAIFVTDDPRFAEDFGIQSEMWMIDHADQFLSEQEIKKAIAAGVAKMAQGMPKQDQIKMLTQILQFPIQSVVQDPDAGSIRDEIAKRLPTKRNILPVYVRAERPFDFENQEHLDDIRSMPGIAVHYQRIRRGEWSTIEEPEVQEAIKDLGFDGFYVKEGGRKNLAVYRPDQLKSVTGNIGTYGQREPTLEEAKQFGLTVEEAKAAQKRGDIRYSLRVPTTPEFKQWSRNAPFVSPENSLSYDFKTGKPFVAGAYHGTNTESDFVAFDIEKGGLQTGAESAQLGIFSTSDPAIAENYASNLGMGRYLKLAMQGSPELKNDPTAVRLDKKISSLEKEYSSLLESADNEARKNIERRMVETGMTFEAGSPFTKEMVVNSTLKSLDLDGVFDFAGPDYKARATKTTNDLDSARKELSRFIIDNEAAKIPQRILPLFIRMKNPMVYDAEGQTPAGFPISDKIAEAKRKGHDGVVFKNIADPSPVAVHYVTFKPDSDIKSGVGNIGIYGQREPTLEEAKQFGLTVEEAKAAQKRGDIRYSLRQQAGQTLGQSYLDTVQRTTTPRVEKGFKDRISEAMSATPFAKFRQMFINKYERIEYYSRELAKQFGDSSLLLADQSAISAALMSDRAAGVAAESFKSGIPVYAKGYTYVDNMGGKVKGLMEILMPLAQRQDPFVYQMFQDYAARRRGVRLDAQGKVTPFSRQELAQIPAIEKQFPEFKQVFEDYQRYNEGLVRYMRDTGVIDAKAAQEWMRYGDYIPFYRQLDGERTVGPSIFSAISGVKAPKKLKGGDAPLGEFLETVVRNSRAAIEAGMRNVAANRVVTNFQRLNSPTAGGKLVERTTEKERDFPDVVMVRENGKDAYYKVADPLLVQSLQALNIPQIPGLDILAKPAEFLREMVTRDPAFIGASVLRESLSAWITTGQKLTPVATGVNQFVKILSNASPTVQALRKAGIGSGYEFKGDVQATAGVFGDQLKRMAGEMTTAQKAVMPLRAMWDGLDKASTAADLSTRAAVFERVLEETGNEAEAIYQAMEVINFSRKGSSPIIQIFAAIIPFLNARIQGLDLLYRAGFGRLASSTAVAQQKAFMLRSLALLGTTAMYYALAQDQEEWKNADQETRDNYWIIGGFKFPIPFELGVMFKVIPERIMAYTMGDDTGEQVRESIARQVLGTLSFNPIPQAVLPLIEASSNYSFFLQRDIVGMGKKDLAPEFQISEGTSQIAIQLGQTLGISPMKIDYIIRGYTGAMGTYAITTMDSIIRSEDDATKATWRLDQIPVLKRFMISDLGAGTVNEYYDLREKLDEVVRTSNQLERTGNIEALTEYLKENGQVLGMKDYIRDLDKDMKSLRESRLAINISRMEPDQKRQSLDALRKAEIALTERINLLRKNMGV